MSREFLMLVQESAYKTPVTIPVVWPTASANAFYIRLDGANTFTMRPRPVMVAVPYGGGVAIDAFRVSDKIECKGRLVTKLYAGALSQFLLQWGGQQINSAQTSPWTTTELAGDLASVSCYHAITRSDGTIKRRVYLGCKVDGWDLDVSEDGTIATLSLDLSGSTPQGNQFDSSIDPTAVTFPPPTDVQLPTNPYVFVHASGGLTIGSSRTQFQSLKLSSKNVLARRFWANRFINLMRFVGRSTTLEAINFYAPSPDDRTSFEGIAGFTTAGGYTGTDVSFALSNGTHSITFDLKNNSVFTALEDQLPLNDLYTQAVTVTNQWDPTTGTDFTVAFT
ncbi:MAG: phage tail tube protein [Isosphaeraceae bacterium]